MTATYARAQPCESLRKLLKGNDCLATVHVQLKQGEGRMVFQLPQSFEKGPTHSIMKINAEKHGTDIELKAIHFVTILDFIQFAFLTSIAWSSKRELLKPLYVVHLVNNPC